MKPSILIVHASGTNRDAEAARACELAGGAPEIVHINQLRSGERTFAQYDMLLVPGGFSYGDALGAGIRMALDMQTFFADQLAEFVASGKPVLGICNGFQVLVKAGLLGLGDEEKAEAQAELAVERTGMADVQAKKKTEGKTETETDSVRRVTLTENERGTFECRWVHLAVESNTKAAALHQIDELIFCPVAHGEGNFQAKDNETLARLEAEGLVALRYVDADGKPVNGRYPLNPNGSVGDIAGICNAQGNVIGLMPHPEDHLLPIQNPLVSTSSLPNAAGRLGLALFESVIASA